jgi:cobalamin-dependent methionine synthase I
MRSNFQRSDLKMLVVGELINASRKAIGQAIKAQDAAAIQKVAVDQKEAGADFIDVNAGIFVGKEADYLEWLVKNVQECTDNAPCCIDSPDPKAIEQALAIHKGVAMINSISMEKDRYDAIMPIVAGTDLKVVALCMDDTAMPETTDERLAIASSPPNLILPHLENMTTIIAITKKRTTARNNHPKFAVTQASVAFIAVSKPSGEIIPQSTRAPITALTTISIALLIPFSSGIESIAFPLSLCLIFSS